MASAGLAALSSVTLAALSFVAGRLLAVIGKGVDEDTAETIFSSGFVMILLPLYAVAFLAISRFDPGAVAAGGTSSPLVGVAVNTVSIVVAGTAVKEAMSRGLRPGIERLQPGTLEVPARFGWLVRAGTGVALLGLALAVMLRQYGLVPFHPAWLLPLFFVAMLVDSLVGKPLSLDPIGWVRSREPTDDELDRIERCYDRFGRTPGFVTISHNETSPGVMAAGTGSFRSVAVTETFLQRVDDTELAVSLASADERARRYQWIYSGIAAQSIPVWLLIAVLLLLSLLTVAWRPATVTTGVATVLCFGVCPLTLWLARRNALRADEFVVSQFDPATVGAVYREFGDELWHREPGGSDAAVLFPEPSLADRLARFGVAVDDSADRETNDEVPASGEQAPDAGVSESTSEPGPSDDTTQSSGTEAVDTDERDWSWPDSDSQ